MQCAPLSPTGGGEIEMLYLNLTLLSHPLSHSPPLSTPHITFTLHLSTPHNTICPLTSPPLTSFCRFHTPSRWVNSSNCMRHLGWTRQSKPHMLKRRLGLSLLYTETKLTSHATVVMERGRRFLISQKTARPLGKAGKERGEDGVGKEQKPCNC